MNGQPPGLLMVWTDIAPELDERFNEWYMREHMPDRVLRIPGFRHGRRFVSTSGSPRCRSSISNRSTPGI